MTIPDGESRRRLRRGRSEDNHATEATHSRSSNSSPTGGTHEKAAGFGNPMVEVLAHGSQC